MCMKKAAESYKKRLDKLFFGVMKIWRTFLSREIVIESDEKYIYFYHYYLNSLNLNTAFLLLSAFFKQYFLP